jgi:hypothetical protein
VRVSRAALHARLDDVIAKRRDFLGLIEARTNARPMGMTSSSRRTSHSSSSRKGRAWSSVTVPRAINSRHAAIERSTPIMATLADPS